MRSKSAGLIEKRLRPKVILKPKKKKINESTNFTMENALAALRVNPADRTPQDVDMILGTVGKWPEFKNSIHSEQERREVCRRINLESKPANSVLFVQGDEPDGWYLVFSGSCEIYINPGNDNYHANIPPSTLSILKNAAPSQQYFLCVATKKATTEFGSTALTQNKPRNATIFVKEPTLLLRVDPNLYRDTAAWFAKAQIERMATLLSHVPQLQFLIESKDLFTRLAENMKEVRIPAGEIIKIDEKDDKADPRCLYIVEEGLLIKQRVVDFGKVKRDEDAQIFDPLAVKLPKGKYTVRTATYRRKSMFPHPQAEGFVPYPCTILVVEPVILYELKISDLETNVPMTQMKRIENSIKDEPTDEQVIEIWIARQKASQWEAFKKKCVKDVRQAVKIEKQIQNGTWCMRKSGNPKPIKEHKPFPPLVANRV